MVLKFEIIKLFDHHNRGQFIAARLLYFKEPVVINDGAILNGIPVYHFLEMHPISKKQREPQFDIYVFRPTKLKGYPKGIFQEGEDVTANDKKHSCIS